MPTSKRVLFVLPLVIGWRTYAGNLQKVLAARDDIEPILCTYTKSDARLWLRVLQRRIPTRGGSKFLVHPIFNGFAWGRRWLHTRRDQGGYDAVHIASSNYAGAFVRHLPSSMPLSIALDVTHRRPVRVMGSILCRNKADELEAEVYERADRFFPLSHWAGSSLVDDYGVPAEKVQVVPPSVLIPGTQATAPRNKIRVDIAFVGNPFEAKGGRDVLAVHQKYFSKSAILHVVSRAFRPSEKLINVLHYPFVENDKLLNQFLPSMDIFCLPTHADMSSFATAEAAAAGLPSIVTDTGGVAELCIEGETGFVIGVRDIDSLADRLQRLIGDPDLRERQGRAARLFAERKLNAFRNYNEVIDRTLECC